MEKIQANYKQQVIDFFNSRTAYDLEGDNHPKEARCLLDYVGVSSGQKILDLATGTGLVAIDAAKAVAPKGSVIGVDLSQGMLAQAKDKIVAQAIENLELIEADVGLIDFKSEQFDVILCCSALVYMSDIAATVDKCYRWLKPGGCFAFTTVEKSSYLAEVKVRLCQDLFGIDLPHILRPLWTAEKCQTILKKSGFQNIEIEQHRGRRYRIDKIYSSTQIEKDFYPRGNPLLDLSTGQRELLQTEYKKAVEQIIAEQGVWQDALNFYIKAWK